MKRRYRWPLWGLLGIALLLLALHLTLPVLVRNYLNDKLADMGDYRGQITDVDLALWRGAYKINGLNIVKASGKVPVPFLEAPLIDLSVSWHALWHDQAVVAEVIFLKPQLNFVDGTSKQTSQTGQGTDWRQQLEKLLPITLNEVRIDDGILSFRNFNSKPPVNLKATQLDASIRNLTNVEDRKGRRDATFDGKARLLGDASVESSATFDPFSDFQDFKFRLRATGIELRRLNDFASAYGKFDFNAGHGDLVIEAEAEKGRLKGYIKPLLRDVDVFNWQQDVESKDKGFFRSIWEALVGGGETVLKNQRKNQFATRVELSGSVHKSDISAFEAFLQILRNGFVQAFNSRYEQPPPKAD
ncbi:AsmA family protein [Pseudomonas sp. ZL2]